MNTAIVTGFCGTLSQCYSIVSDQPFRLSSDACCRLILSCRQLTPVANTATHTPTVTRPPTCTATAVPFHSTQQSFSDSLRAHTEENAICKSLCRITHSLYERDSSSFQRLILIPSRLWSIAPPPPPPPPSHLQILPGSTWLTISPPCPWL